MKDEQHYTFGDSDEAAERLAQLARAFDSSTRAWLASLSPALPRGARVVDLGCGPGFSTELLAQELAPSHLYGFELSERLAARAARSAIATRARFFVQDVSQVPFPVPPAALLYARFLLTHLASPVSMLALWARAAAPRGRLLLEETAVLESEHPVFRRYYALVEALQRHYGQAMYIGERLRDLARATPWTVEHARIQPVAQPASVMARLHALNLKSWSRDPFALACFDRAELSELERALEAIAASAEAPPVIVHMAQVCLVKAEPAPLGAVRIEAARPEQAGAVLALQRSAFAIEAERDDAWSIAPLQQTAPELAREITEGQVLVALDAGEIVGSVRARTEGATAHIGRLMVRPDLQGRGIARHLMAAIEARLPTAERFELFTSASALRNLRLYETLGYRRVGQGRDCGGIDVVYLAKERPFR